VPTPRRAYLDWLRGVAVLCMIEWHVISSWAAPEAHTSGFWPTLVLIGGQAAPLFLFLAGVSVPFAINSHISRGATPERASWLVQKRGWQVFLIAHLFRLQSFITNPHATWSSIFKPDILNILGLGLVATAWLTGLSRRNRASGEGGGRSLLLIIPALVLLLTPWSRSWWWPTLLPARLEAYIHPNGYGVFELFPWFAYVPVGAFVGLILAAPRDQAGESRLHWRLALEGAVMVATGYSMASMPLPEPIAYWTAVPSQFVMQTGWMILGIWIAWLWMRTPVANATSGPLLLFGRTSLFVYWVHVEIAFGFISYPLHSRLRLPWAIAGFVLVTVIMYLAALWWSGRAKQPLIPVELRAAT
jgi:uncharacterized membrane protein